LSKEDEEAGCYLSFLEVYYSGLKMMLFILFMFFWKKIKWGKNFLVMVNG